MLNKKNASCVGGPTKHFSNTFIGRNISIAQCSYFGAGGASFRTGVSKGKYVNTLAFGAYKRAEFLKVGAYDEELIRNQDEELNYRIVKNGGKIWIDPSIKSIYYVRNSILKLFTQYFYYGFYKVRVIQKIKSIFSLRHLVPAIFVLTLILFVVIAIFQKIFWPILFFWRNIPFNEHNFFNIRINKKSIQVIGPITCDLFYHAPVIWYWFFSWISFFCK